jgi:hypothetical protein
LWLKEFRIRNQGLGLRVSGVGFVIHGSFRVLGFRIKG